MGFHTIALATKRGMSIFACLHRRFAEVMKNHRERADRRRSRRRASSSPRQCGKQRWYKITVRPANGSASRYSAAARQRFRSAVDAGSRRHRPRDPADTATTRGIADRSAPDIHLQDAGD